MTKFRLMYLEMYESHKEEFEEFKKIHDLYRADQAKWSEEFNVKGKPILDIVQEAENRLCAKMEGGGKGAYSARVAEKFRDEVRAYLPLIDFVGVKVS